MEPQLPRSLGTSWETYLGCDPSLRMPLESTWVHVLNSFQKRDIWKVVMPELKL